MERRKRQKLEVVCGQNREISHPKQNWKGSVFFVFTRCLTEQAKKGVRVHTQRVKIKRDLDRQNMI